MMRSCFAAVGGWKSLAVLALCATIPQAKSQDLTITSTHTGAFQLGQTNAYYLLRVKNVGTAPTSGLVSVTENAPSGLTVTSMYGDGWTCTVNSCSRSDALAAGALYPAIMAVASVAQSAGVSLTNQATVSGGGDTNAANNTASDVTKVAANGYPVGWGNNDSGQALVPAGLSNVVAISTGLVLKSDGTVVAWGGYAYWDGPEQVDKKMPAGLSGVVAIAGGDRESLALKSDGTVVGWGDNTYGWAKVPAGLSNVIAIATSGDRQVAIKSDGTVVGWGADYYGESTVEAGLSNIVAIASGGTVWLALKNDGTVIVWGPSRYPEMNLPAGLSDIVAIAGTGGFGLVLKSDGTVIAWGENYEGETNVPAGLSDVIAIGTGGNHALAIKSDGTVVAWGRNNCGQASVPDGIESATAVAGGGLFSVVLMETAPKTFPVIVSAQSNYPWSGFAGVAIDGTSFRVSLTSTSPLVVQWMHGSNHTLGVTSPSSINATTQAVFSNWSDGGAATHNVSPTSETTYTATFKAQVTLTTLVNPATAGSISPATGFVDADAPVQITATPNAGYGFNGFTGDLTGKSNPQILRVNWDARTVTANFVPASPGLSVVKTHSGNFTQGQSGATYTVTVLDAAGSARTSGTVIVKETLPSGLSLVSMGGAGWNCPAGGSTCSRDDALSPGNGYPPITVVVNVAADATSPQVNQVSASGGGSSPASASDATIVQVVTPPNNTNNRSFELGSTSQTSFTGTAYGGSSAATSWYAWNNNPGTTTTELCDASSCPSGSVPPAPVDGSRTIHVITTGASSGIYQFFPKLALAGASVWLHVVSGKVKIELLGPAARVVQIVKGTGATWLPANGGLFNELVLYSWSGVRTEFYADAVTLNTSPLVPPNLLGLSPTSGPVGASVTITGTGFGASQGGSSVAFNGALAVPIFWSDTKIEVIVPTGAATGDVLVTVRGQPSNPRSFTLTRRLIINPSFELGSPAPVSFTGLWSGGDSAASAWSVWNNHPGTTMTELCTATACPSGSVPPVAPAFGTHSLHVTTTDASSGVYQVFSNTAIDYGSVSLRIVSGAVRVELVGPGGPIAKVTHGSGIVWLPANGALLKEIVIYSSGSAPADFYVDAVTLSPSAGIVANSSFEAGSSVPIDFTGTGSGGVSAATGWSTWNNSPGTTTTELCAATGCPSGSVVPAAPVAGSRMLHVTTTVASSGVYQTFPSSALEYGCLWLQIVRGTVVVKLLGSGGPIAVTASSSDMIWVPANGAAINEIVVYSSSSGPTEFYIDAVAVAR